MLMKFGSSARESPSSLETSAPTLGYWMPAAPGNWPVRIRYVPRAWSPSFVDMPRRIASRSPCFAIFGRCSPILRPGAEVSISLYGPPFSCPTFRSHKSMVLGPPFIHRRMHDRLGWVRDASAARASLPIHPDIETVVLTAPTRSNCLRDIRESRDGMADSVRYCWQVNG